MRLLRGFLTLLLVGVLGLINPLAARAEEPAPTPETSATSADQVAPATEGAAADVIADGEMSADVNAVSETTTVTVDAVAPAQESDGPDDQAPAGTPDVALGQGPIPAGRTGGPVHVVVPLVNRGSADAQSVLVGPKPAVDPANFSFEITQTDYTVEVGTMRRSETAEVDLGTFTLRGGLASGYYAMPLAVQYADTTGIHVSERTIFVNVEGVAQPEPNTPQPLTSTPPPNIEVIVNNPAADGGGVPAYDAVGGEVVPSGGGGGAAQPVAASGMPRVMLTQFATNPSEVQAGSEFTLSFALQNMSQRVGVGNLKVTVVSADASFLPIGGASSVYIDAIGAGQSATRELNFRSLPTLEERPYQLTLRIEYEEQTNYTALAAEESIAVVVRQRARAETGPIQVLPSTVSVGQDANVSFTVQNHGKVRLYNTRATVKQGQAVSGSDVFVGNIEPGATGSVDMMVHADSASTDPITIEISYEDSAGVSTSFERQITLSVTEEVSEPVEEVQETASGPGIPIIPILLLALLAIAAVVVIYVWRERRKRRKEAELAESLASLDTEPIITDDPPYQV